MNIFFPILLLFISAEMQAAELDLSLPDSVAELYQVRHPAEPERMLDLSPKTYLGVYFISYSNHMTPGATSADEPFVELAPGVNMPAYNEKNWGIMIEISRPNTFVSAGRYRNSFFNYSNIFLSGVGVNIWKYQTGLCAGFVDGYTENIEGLMCLYIKGGPIHIMYAKEFYNLQFLTAHWEFTDTGLTWQSGPAN